MTTKLEELRAAFETASEYSLGFSDSNMLDFAHLAHNTMPALLEAVNHLAECQELLRECPWVYQECKRILEKLK